MRTPQAEPDTTTHFEQIPVDAVKKIVRSGTHDVQFYDDSDALCRIVGACLGEGLKEGALALVIATPDHAARIDACLRDRGFDVEALKRGRELFVVDARDTLQLFMNNGVPNPGAFRRAMRDLLTVVKGNRRHCVIRAYGEMVDLLWKDGHKAAAIHLETLWNQLGDMQDFELLCGYSIGNFYKGAASS